MIDAVTIREVGPRDGLQAESPVPIDKRAALVRTLAGAGLRVIEAVSFASPKAVPAMAGAEEVVAAVDDLDGVTLVGLVLNRRGAERAMTTALDALTFTLSASAIYNERNVGMTIDQSVEQLRAIVAIAADRPIDCVVSYAFAEPPDDVAALAARCLDAGASSLTLADTTGVATPRRVEELLARTGTEVSLHLHDTRGTALVNAYSAMTAGVRRFDTSVGGLGGSPFAPEAGGNLATEDLVHVCDDLGITTGVDLTQLLEVSTMVAELVGHPVPSRIAAAATRHS